MTETTTHKTLEALLQDAEAMLIEEEAEEEAAAADYDRRMRESTEKILTDAGIDVSELRWKDGEYIWGDYTFSFDGECHIDITYTHPQLPGILTRGFAQEGASADKIGTLMLRLKYEAEEQEEETEKVTLYEADTYKFSAGDAWNRYAERIDLGWRTHQRQIVMDDGEAWLCVVWTMEVEV